MEQKNNKFVNFIKLHKDYLITFAVIFVIYNLLLIINSGFPYGSNTILVSDSYYQIGMFINHIFDMFEGKTSFFYTNAIGGGMEVFSTIQYMLMSPFYIIPLLGGRNYALPLFNISAFFMLLFVAFTFLWFSKKYFKNISLTIRLLFTFLYTFSSYILLNSAFLTWLIYPALILLLVDAFINLVNNGKVVKFCVFLVWYVINCYSIGICTNILIFMLFSLYIFIMKEKGERAPAYTKLLLAYVIGICASVIILFPSIVATFSSGRTDPLFDILTASFNKQYWLKFTPFLLDGIISIFAIFYFIKADKKDKSYKFWIIAFVLTLVPVIFDGSLRLLCGSGYAGFLHRFYFINEVIVFVLALSIFDKNLLTFKEEAKSSKMIKALFIFMISIAFICFAFFYIMNGDSFSSTTKNPINANLSIVVVALLLFICSTLIFSFVYFFNKRGIVSTKFAKGSMILAMVFTLSLNCFNFISYYQTDYSYLYKEDKMVSSTNISGRVQYFNYIGACSNYYNANTKSIAGFSSLLDKKIMESYKNIGLNARLVDVLYSGETLITDSLMGLKYVITSQKENRPYLKEIASNEDIYIYENTLATTGAILFEKDIDKNLDLSTIEGLEKFKQELGIEGTLIKEINPQINELEKEIDGIYKLYEFNYTSDSDEILYSNFSSNIITDEDQEKYFTSNEILEGVVLMNDDLKLYCDFGFANKDNQISKIMVIKDEPDFKIEDVKFYVMNYEVASQMCEKLQKMQAQIEYKNNGYVVSLNSENGGHLFISTVNINGLNYTLNNEKISVDEIFGGFAYVNIKSGENTIVATYKYPHVNSWIIIAVLCLVLIIVSALFIKFDILKRIGKAINVSIYAINLLLMLFFIFFGIILTFIVVCL